MESINVKIIKKMKNRLIFIVCFFYLFLFAFSLQAKTLFLNSYIGNDSVLTTIIKKYYQKNAKVFIYRPSDEISSICSVLIIVHNNDIQYWCTRNDSILETGNLISKYIFQYKNIFRCNTIQKEIKYINFIPPLMCQEIKTESVTYKDAKNLIFFEYGINASLNPDSKLEKYRAEWLTIIHKELVNILNKYPSK
jgi:hypothetical protein